MPPPNQVTSILATDESLLIRCGGDYGVLCPEWQKMAYGTDGVISGWTLTSTAVNFATNGVSANMVIRLDRPVTSFAGAGEWFAIESVSGNVATLRRPGKAASSGQSPPAVSSVRFTVLTFGPQLEEASFDLYQRFSLDDADPLRAPTLAYDLRVLRRACVLTVLKNRYLAESRDKQGDFEAKYLEMGRELADAIEVIRIRWGPTADAQPATSIFGARYH